MKRLAVLVLAIAGVIGVAPATSGALPPDFVAPPNSIIGTVTDQNGRPLPDILVTDANVTAIATTDLDGTFLLENLAAGTEYTLMTNDPSGNFLAGQSQPVTVSDLAGVRADITLQGVPTTSVSGTVTDTDGAPLAGIVLRESQTGGQTTSAADGTYLLGGIRSDLVLAVSATDPTGLHRDTSVFPPSVAADGATVVDITMAAQVPSVVGVVTDPDGLPVAGARVQLTDFSFVAATTGPDGRFAFGELGVDGTFTISVDPRSNRPDLRPVDILVTFVAGTTVDASVQLSRVATIDVTVTAGGAPAEAQATVWSTNGFSVGSQVVGADGKVSIPVLDDGQYYVQVDSITPGYASEFYPNTIFRASATLLTITGEQHVPVQVSLEREAIIAGTITMPDGSPGDYTQVAAIPLGLAEGQFPELGGCNLPKDTDPPGTFRIGCLHPSATWLIKGFGLDRADNGYYRNSQSAFNATRFTLRPGQVVQGVTLRLAPKSPSPTFTGMSQTYFVTGTTTRGVRIYGTGFPRDFHALLIDTGSQGIGPDTTITITDVVSPTEVIATVTVQPGAIGDFAASRDCFIRTSLGGFAEAFNFFTSGDPNLEVGAISGTVTDTRGKAVRGVGVRFTSLDGSIVRHVVTGSDGSYRGTGLLPGQYEVLFEGSETLNGQFWKGATTAAAARPVTVIGGRTQRNVSAQLTRRAPITVTSASPDKVPGLSPSFDLVGTGLSAITGGFRVTVDTGFFPVPFNVRPTSDTTLHATGFGFVPGGVHDVIVEWTTPTGAVRRTVCTDCLTVYGNFFVSSVTGAVIADATTTLQIEGDGFFDLTAITVNGTGITVDSWTVNSIGSIDVTVTAAAGAAPDPDLGYVILTLTRADGSTADVGVAFQPVDVPV